MNTFFKKVPFFEQVQLFEFLHILLAVIVNGGREYRVLTKRYNNQKWKKQDECKCSDSVSVNRNQLNAVKAQKLFMKILLTL